MEDSIAQAQWQTWMAKLQEPFDPEEVDYRVQRATMVVAYVDARTVAKRLDDAVGAQNWTFDWSPVSISDKGEVQFAKGTLTIAGVTKSDIGDASNQDASKGAVSDALKRAAVLFGVGRYLYDLPVESVVVDKGKPTKEALRELRARLPRPEGYTPPTPRPTPMKQRYATVHALPEQETAPAPSPATARPEPYYEPTEQNDQKWRALKARAFKAKMATTPEQWNKLMEQTGASYEETLGKVEKFEQRDLRDLGASAKGRH